MKLVAIAVLLVCTASLSHAQEQYMELLRTDLKTQRKEIIISVMKFSEADAEKFWKMYREYEMQRTELGDRYVALVKKYADNYADMTVDVADETINDVFDLEQDRIKTKKSFYKDLKKAFGAITAARFIQLENIMDRLLDLQVTSELPLLEEVHP